jgi:hypothetical protein
MSSVALLLIKLIDLGIAAAEGSQRARAELLKVKQASRGGVTAKFIATQTAEIEALEEELFTDPEDSPRSKESGEDHDQERKSNTPKDAGGQENH